MNYLHSFALFATLFASNAVGEQIVPQGDCNFWKQAECGAAAAKIVSDISGMSPPPSVDDVNAVFLNGKAFFQQCKSCIYEHQTAAICKAIDKVVEEASKFLEIDVDFDEKQCIDEGIVGAVTDLIKEFPDISMSEVIDGTAQGLVSLGVSASEARSIAMDNAAILPAYLTPVSSIKNACANLDFDFFKIVSHDGKICGNRNGLDSSVTVSGSFSVLGNTLARYNERFDRSREYCVHFSAMVYKMSPCLRVDMQRQTVNICVKGEWCVGPFGCTDMGKVCTETPFSL